MEAPEVLLETTQDDHISAKFIYGYSRISQINNNIELLYLYDAPKRNVTALIDTSESIVNEYSYSAFGTFKGVYENNNNSFKYVGEQYDKETGLIFLRARYYDPEIGRFISKDPFYGYKKDPQSKNPYVYCKNNPIKYIDPSGFKDENSIQDLSGTFQNASELVSRANEVNDYQLGDRKDDLNQGMGIINFATWSVGIMIEEAFKIDGVSEFVDSNLKIEEEHFIPQNISPLLEHNETIYNIGDELWDDNSTEVGPQSLLDFNDSLAFNYNYSVTLDLDFGGVSLSKTANLMLNINDIAGATYDEGTGQIILYGKEDISLPSMTLDDLAVAVRSVYGFGGQSPQDPGVSIGTEPSDVPGQMKVRYDGQTLNTEFGYTMFEADRILKSLTLGKDNITGISVSTNVPGYMSMPARYALDGGIPGGQTMDRMWFVPKDITLVQSDDDSSMLFSHIEMELLTESKFNDNVIDNQVAGDFASHFTANYDQFAADTEYPILQELKRLGKITSVVKWIKDNNIPFDLSFFENFTPEYDNRTPGYTPQTTASVPYAGGTITATGGVKYRLDSNNYDDSGTDMAAGDVQQEAVTTRPAETQFQWDFQAEGLSGLMENFKAVAQSLTRSKKDGNVKKAITDMRFPVRGKIPLAFTRYYDSFNDKKSALGFGWDVTPYKLRFPANKQLFTIGDNELDIEAHPKIYVREGGNEYLYELFGVDYNDQALYARKGGKKHLRENLDGSYDLIKPNRGVVSFDAMGKLTRMADSNDAYVAYNYSGDELVSISHEDGRTISINYTGGRISSVAGPGGKTVSFGYNADNNIVTVTNEENDTFTYNYDEDKRLSSISDPRGNRIFQASYDEYNRAYSKTIGLETGLENTFYLSERVTQAVNGNGVTTTKIYDADFRPTQINDSTGRIVDISYNTNNFGPETVTDPRGNTTQYGYDTAGNLNYLKNAEDEEKRYLYDINNNLVGVRDAKGKDTVYVYDANNRMTEIRLMSWLQTDANGQFTGSYTYDPNYVVQYEYDEDGNVGTVTDPEGNSVTFDYDANGMPGTTYYPSGYQETRTYDARSRLSRIMNPGGQYVNYTYDNADRVTAVTTAGGSVNITYDPNGNIDVIYDGNNNPTDYDYDENNNLVQVTDAEGGITRYEYDTVNNTLTRIILPNGAIKEIDYDELNRPVQVRYVITEPLPSAAVVGETVDVGSAVVGHTSTGGVTIYNTGNAPLNITDAYTNNPNFTVNTTATVINPGESYTFEVSYTGALDGNNTAVLTLVTDDPDQPQIQVNLTSAISYESLGAAAVSISNAIELTWNQYSVPALFDHYCVYRETEEITDISGLTPVATLNMIDGFYTDDTVVIGEEYYYCVVAFGAEGNRLSAIDPIGPVTLLNLGRVGAPLDAASAAYNEQSPAFALNPADNEYLLVYAKDVSGAGTNWNVYGQLIDLNNEKIGSEFAIFSTANNEKNPRVVYNTQSDEYMVVAECDVTGSGMYRIKAQRLSIGGTLIGSAINIYAGQASQNSPAIAYNSVDNEYLVGFETDLSGDGYADFMRLQLSSTGAVLNSPCYYLPNTHFRKPVISYNSSSNEYLGVFEYTDDANYSYITALRFDSAGDLIGDIITIAAKVYMSTRPDVIYDPDQNRYAVSWQYDSGGTGNAYGFYVRLVSYDGIPGSNHIYSIDGVSMLNPDLSYVNNQSEFMLTFTQMASDGENNVYGQRISAIDLSLLAEHTIGVATIPGKVEQNSRVVYNAITGDFIVGYEYDNGNDWDIRTQYIGNITENLSVVPNQMDFGSALIQDTLGVTEITGKSYMHLTNSTDQPWLSVTPGGIINPNENATATLTVSVNRAGIEVGNYIGHVNILCDGLNQTIPVSMEVANTVPDSPVNPLPENNSTDQANMGYPLSVNMSWSCADANFNDALIYDVYFSDNQSLVNNMDPSALVSDDQTPTSYQSIALGYGKTYYWRVKAKDSFGLTASGDVWNFTVIDIPSPELNAVTPDPTSDRTPNLSWVSVPGAPRYHLQVDDTSDFSSPIIDDNSITAADYAVASNLPEGNIFWRVASIDQDNRESSFSSLDEFSIDGTAPLAPALNPVADPTKNRRPEFSWSAVSDAVNYHIQIAEDAGFQSNLVNAYVSQTSYIPSSNLPEGDIYWKVSALDQPGNEGGFSNYHQFTVDISGPAQVTGLTAVREGNGLRLNWGYVPDSDFDHFNIYRSGSPITNIISLTPVDQSISDPEITTYFDNSVTHGRYYYAVTTVDVLGNENQSVNSTGPVFVNTAPVTVNDQYLTDEDTTLVVSLPGVMDNDTDSDNDPLAVTLQTFPANGALTFNADGSFSYEPNENFYGQDSFVYRVNDGYEDSSDATVTIVINEMNDPPFVSPISDQTVQKNQATDVLTFTVGDPETASGMLVISSSSDNPSLVPDGNIVLGGSGANRIVTVTPAVDQTGTATITITVEDESSVATSEVFILTVNENNSPVLSDVPDQTIDEDGSTALIGFSVNDAETSPDSLIVTAVCDNQALVPNENIMLGGSGTNRTIAVTPAGDESGFATITITVQDEDLNTSSDAFIVTVNPVNDIPTISSIPDQAIDEDTSASALPFTVDDIETPTEALTVSASSDNQAIVADSGMVINGTGADRTLTVTPVPNAFGETTITISVADQDGGISNESFLLTVNGIEDAPVISEIPAHVTDEDAATGQVQFTVTDPDTPAEDLIIDAVESNSNLGAPCQIEFGGSGDNRWIQVTPPQNASGTTTISVRAHGGPGAHEDFILTVNPVNDAPSIEDIEDRATQEDHPFMVSDIYAGDVETIFSDLNASVVSSNQNVVGDADILILKGSQYYSLHISPISNGYGETIITFTVEDADGGQSQESFLLTVTSSNDMPSISNIPNQVIDEDGTTGPLAFTVGDIETSPEQLTMTATSSDQSLVPNGNIAFGGAGAGRTVNVSPAPDAWGEATITVTVHDADNGTRSDSFVITVNPEDPCATCVRDVNNSGLVNFLDRLYFYYSIIGQPADNFPFADMAEPFGGTIDTADFNEWLSECYYLGCEQ